MPDFITRTRQPEETVTFVDLNTNFARDQKGLTLQDIDAISNQIYNILATEVGERVFEPEFGSNLRDYVFDPTDETTGWLIETEIDRALGRWMPRIQVIREQTHAVPYPAERYFEVSIRYQLIGTGIQDTLTFNLTQLS